MSESRLGRLSARLPRPSARLLRGLAIASLVTNIGIVVTGGAVRLTNSGLGCPTVPRCTPDSLVPHPALGIHGYIEFSNRLLTFVVGGVGILLWLAALRFRPRVPGLRALTTAVAFGIPAQALVGMIVVATELNPWTVMGHFLVSMVLVMVSTLVVRLTRETGAVGPGSGPSSAGRLRRTVPGPVRTLAIVTFAAACAVIYVGAVVTGTGPHAGDAKARRTGLDLAAVAQLHADLVFLLLGCTIGTVLAFAAVKAPVRARRAVLVLLGIELAQGAVGFTQYATNLPVLLVGLHMLGAAALAAAVTSVVLGTREREAVPGAAGPGAAGAGAAGAEVGVVGAGVAGPAGAGAAGAPGPPDAAGAPGGNSSGGTSGSGQDVVVPLRR